MVSGVVAQVHLNSRSSGSLNPLCGHLSSSIMHKWERHTQQLVESHIYFLYLLIHLLFISLPFSLQILLPSPLPFCLFCPSVSIS